MQMLLFHVSCGWQSRFDKDQSPRAIGSSKSTRAEDPTREGLARLQGNADEVRHE